MRLGNLGVANRADLFAVRFPAYFFMLIDDEFEFVVAIAPAAADGTFTAVPIMALVALGAAPYAFAAIPVMTT